MEEDCNQILRFSYWILQTQHPSCDAPRAEAELPGRVISTPYTVLKAVITEHLLVLLEEARAIIELNFL
jgi:hypothetical protein